MSPEKPNHRKWSADGLLGCSTDDVDEFVNDGMLLPVSDWMAMHEDARKCLLDRITQRSRELHGASPPRDEHAVSDQEMLIQCEENPILEADFPPPESPRPKKSQAMSEIMRKRLFETLDYNALVEDGGRPLYPIHLLQIVSEHQEKYSELLRPWMESLAEQPTWHVFEKQLVHWKAFRDWQRDNRDLGIVYRQFPHYLARMKLVEETSGGVIWPDEVDAKRIQCLHDSWKKSLEIWEKKRLREKETGCETLSDYAEVMKRRLSQHNVTRPFDLNEDPFKQDTMTTWLEYLAYEYQTNEGLAGWFKRAQQSYEKQRRGLQDSGMLQDHETPEYVRDNPSLTKKQLELKREQLRKEAGKAVGEFDKAYWPLRRDELPPSRSEHTPALYPSIERLESTRTAALDLERSSNIFESFCAACDSFKNAKATFESHTLLTAWAKDQIPLIEAELAAAKSRKRPLEGEPAEEKDMAEQPSTKRPKRTHDGEPSRQADENRMASDEPSPPPLEPTSGSSSDQAATAVFSNPQDEQKPAATSVLQAKLTEAVVSEPVAQESAMREPVAQEPVDSNNNNTTTTTNNNNNNNNNNKNKDKTRQTSQREKTRRPRAKGAAATRRSRRVAGQPPQ